MLEALGCRVQLVGNGLEAVQALSRSGFDLILMDCQMPEMDGYQATDLIRDSERAAGTEAGRVPIVALTAHAMEGAREKCLAAGMDDYLAKPFSQDQLGEVLGRWLKPASAKRCVAADKGKGTSETSTYAEETLPVSIDPKALETIRALQQQGKPDLLARVINIYLEDSLRLLEELRQSLSEGNGPDLKRQAHSLKSSSANVGALRLAELCRELETTGQTESMDEIGQRIARIEKEYGAVRSELAAELVRTSA